jgi:hypothetical protein
MSGESDTEYLFRRHGEICAAALELMEAKNHDYTNGQQTTGGAYANFMLTEHLGLGSAEKGMAIRMSDKMIRICTLISKEGKVKDESLEDTLRDMINYSILMLTLRERRNSGDLHS